jgi:hypothetical protein
MGDAFIEQFDSYGAAEDEWKDLVNKKLEDHKRVMNCNITPIMEGVIPEGFIINGEGDIEKKFEGKKN